MEHSYSTATHGSQQIEPEYLLKKVNIAPGRNNIHTPKNFLCIDRCRRVVFVCREARNCVKKDLRSRACLGERPRYIVGSDGLSTATPIKTGSRAQYVWVTGSGIWSTVMD